MKIVAFSKNHKKYNCRYNDFIGDGICDDVLNHEECCYDSSDCDNHMNCTLNCPYNTKFLGDGACDKFLAIPECCYDNGDCLEAYKPDHGGPNYPIGAFANHFEPSVEQVMWFEGNNPLERIRNKIWVSHSDWLDDARSAVGTYKRK